MTTPPRPIQTIAEISFPMDGEIKNFIQVWTLAISSLCYCFYITPRIRSGLSRLLSLLPIFYLSIILPLNLTSTNLGGFTAFLLVWLANFKLLLFAFDQGPLSPAPSKLSHFISITCLPIKIKQEDEDKSHEPSKSTAISPPLSKPVLLGIKLVLLSFIIYAYIYRRYLHQNVLLVLYCCHVYLQLEITLAICAAPIGAIFGFELEPQFDEPYLATSLQDFWSRRWNLMVTSILRSTVYTPIRRVSAHLIGHTLASLLAVIASFVVSGLMHEVLYYYITRAAPTWEVTSFFILHGVCVIMEVAIKRVFTDKWQLHPIVTGPLVVVFVAVTSVWLFWPQLLRNGVDDRTIGEFFNTIDFVKNKFY